jgi:hypothetical protein
VKLRLHSVLSCLLLAAAVGKSQEPASPQPPPPPPTEAPASPSAPAAQAPSATLRPPVEVPSTVNTGHGLSIDTIYWFGRSRPVLRGGDANANSEPGNFNYITNPNAPIGYRLSIPIGTNGVVRTSYFQTQSTGFAIAPANLILFGQAIVGGDLVATRYRMEDIKVSYEYLTYFWKRSSSEIRLKTLYEVQRISVTNEVDDFVLNNDQTTYTINTATGSRAILLPTFGLGIEYTMSPHFRIEARGSGFGYLHHADIGDVEATVAYRRGHVEAIGGYRLLHFKTSPKSDQYNAGTLSGPYVGIRLYWKKQ